MKKHKEKPSEYNVPHGIEPVTFVDSDGFRSGRYSNEKGQTIEYFSPDNSQDSSKITRRLQRDGELMCILGKDGYIELTGSEDEGYEILEISKEIKLANGELISGKKLDIEDIGTLCNQIGASGAYHTMKTRFELPMDDYKKDLGKNPQDPRFNLEHLESRMINPFNINGPIV